MNQLTKYNSNNRIGSPIYKNRISK